MSTHWHAWTATAAFYDQRDPISFLMALTSLLPIFIVIFVAGYASAPSTRQGPAFVLLLGFVYNTLLNAALKVLIRSPRPPHPSQESAAPSAHGMPSDHAQFLFFFVTWLMRRGAGGGEPMRTGMRVFLIAAAVLVSYSRIYNGFHYPRQVIFGALVGAVNACLCASPVGEYVLRQLVEVLLPVRDFCTTWTEYIR